MNTTTITVYDLGRLQDKVDSLNKKAHKAGVSPITWSLLGTVAKKVTKGWGDSVRSYEVFDHYEVEVKAEEIVLPGGYRLVGVIDHAEGLTRSVPGAEKDLRYFVDRGPVCDHCHTSRDRSETFILDGDFAGDVKQVGRTCLGLFLGITPERALNLVGMASESMVFDEEWTGTPKAKGVDLDFFLAHAACMVRTAGWRSRSSASSDSPATADMALDNMDNAWRKQRDHYGSPLWIDPSDADGYLGNQVATWLEDVASRSGLSDYMANLAQIGQNQFVTFKSAGYAASAINAYLKEKEEAIKVEKRRAQGGGHVGTVGERIKGLSVEKVFSSGYDTEWGYTFFHRFIDGSGNVLVWRTTSEVENGPYVLTGTVKGHDEYKGEAQTNLTRCSLK